MLLGKSSISLVLVVLNLIFVCPLAQAEGLSHFQLFYSWCKDIKPVTRADVKIMERISGMSGVPAFTPMPTPGKFYLESFKKALVDNKFFSKTVELDLVLSNPEFKNALEKCFPKDSYSQEYYVTSLSYMDASAKMSAGVSFIALGFGASALLARAGKIGRYLSFVLNAGVFYSLSISARKAYLKYMSSKDPDKAVKEELREFTLLQIATARKELDLLNKELLKTPEDKELLELKQNRIDILKEFEIELRNYL